MAESDLEFFFPLLAIVFCKPAMVASVPVSSSCFIVLMMGKMFQCFLEKSLQKLHKLNKVRSGLSA